MPRECCDWRNKLIGVTGLLCYVPADCQLEVRHGLSDSLLLVSPPYDHWTAFCWHKTWWRL